MHRKVFIALLLTGFALFATMASARTAWPPGAMVDQVIQGQDVTQGVHALEAYKGKGAIAAVELHLFGFTTVLAEVKTFDTPSDAEHIGGLACLAYTKPEL